MLHLLVSGIRFFHLLVENPRKDERDHRTDRNEDPEHSNLGGEVDLCIFVPRGKRWECKETEKDETEDRERRRFSHWNSFYKGLKIGKGIANALKHTSLHWAKNQGFKTIRTNNVDSNDAMLNINIRAGFTFMPAWLIFDKILK